MLIRTSLLETRLREADFSYANLSGADLSGAVVALANFTGAKYSLSTIFAEDFDPIQAGMQLIHIPS